MLFLLVITCVKISNSGAALGLQVMQQLSTVQWEVETYIIWIGAWDYTIAW